jgi:hypothetical protein
MDVKEGEEGPIQFLFNAFLKHVDTINQSLRYRVRTKY